VGERAVTEIETRAAELFATQNGKPFVRVAAWWPTSPASIRGPYEDTAREQIQAEEREAKRELEWSWWTLK
jgi:hypothetical protein